MAVKHIFPQTVYMHHCCGKDSGQGMSTVMVSGEPVDGGLHQADGGRRKYLILEEEVESLANRLWVRYDNRLLGGP